MIVSFVANRRLLRRYAEELGIDVPIYADSERAAYRAFGFGRASVRRTWLDPRVWGRYAQLVVRRRPLRAPQQDTLQLGGDVVSGADGVVRWVYRSKGPEDRPSVDQLAEALSG